jgi:hypothetical protein
MSCLKTWEMKCIKRGDTFKAKTITFPFNITGCTFLMQFRKSEIGVNTNDVAFEWKSSDNSFQITNAANGVLLMNKKVMNFEPNFYVSDLQITRANNDIETLFNAKIEITQDISRP